MASLFDSFRSLFLRPMHLHHLGDAITYTFADGTTRSINANFVQGSKILETHEKGSVYTQIADVFISTEDATNGITVAELADFAGDSITWNGLQFAVLAADARSTAGPLAHLKVRYAKDRARLARDTRFTIGQGGAK